MTGILSGKTALVTGGASGIGRATALALAREGASVAVADMTEAAAATTDLPGCRLLMWAEIWRHCCSGVPTFNL